MKVLQVILIFSGLVFSQHTFASYIVGAFNPQWGYWQQSDLNYSLTRGQNFFVGKIFDWGQMEASFSEYEMRTGNSTLNYKDTYENLFLTASRAWVQKNLASDLDLQVYYLGGIGAARNKVTSNFQTSQTTNTSSLRMAFQAGVGVGFLFKLSEGLKLVVGADSKLQRDQEIKPANYITFQMRLGLIF